MVRRQQQVLPQFAINLYNERWWTHGILFSRSIQGSLSLKRGLPSFCCFAIFLRFIINNNSRKSPISRRILGIARCKFGVQLDINTRKCASRPIANHGAQGSQTGPP
jgi:hypothetical protein